MNLKSAEEKLKKAEKEIEAELKKVGEVTEMGTDVDHFDEETDEAEEYSTNLGVNQVLKERLRAVKKSLDKVGNGTYGKCEHCGEMISDAVLEAAPESELCQEHKK